MQLAASLYSSPPSRGRATQGVSGSLDQVGNSALLASTGGGSASLPPGLAVAHHVFPRESGAVRENIGNALAAEEQYQPQAKMKEN